MRQTLTQETLAAKAGYTKRTIERLESGHRGLPPTVSDIAEALDVNVRDLVGSGELPVRSTIGRGYVHLIERTVTSFDLPDLLTPGPSAPDLVAALASQMGSPLAHRLGILSEAAVSAVENGDFALHVSIGQQIEADAGGFREVEAAGRYFTAEGYRLQADLEPDAARKDALLQSAIEYYSLSLESWPNNPRALRGLARVNEVQQRFDEAMTLFEHAKGLVPLQG